MLTSNKTYIAHEVYHRHVANVGAVSGVEGTVKSRLEAYVTDLAYNVKHGGNNKVFEYGAALTSGTAITGNNTQDTALLNNILLIWGDSSKLYSDGSAGLDDINNLLNSIIGIQEENIN